MRNTWELSLQFGLIMTAFLIPFGSSNTVLEMFSKPQAMFSG